MTAQSEYATGAPVVFDRGEMDELLHQLVDLGAGFARASENISDRGHAHGRCRRAIGALLGFKPDDGLDDVAEGIHQDAFRLVALAKGVQAAIEPGLQVGGNGSAHVVEPTEGEPPHLSRYAAQHLVDGGER